MISLSICISSLTPPLFPLCSYQKGHGISGDWGLLTGAKPSLSRTTACEYDGRSSDPHERANRTQEEPLLRQRMTWFASDVIGLRRAAAIG